MAVIDIGPGAVTQSSTWNVTRTVIDLNNPANDTGNLTSAEFYFSSGDGLNVKVGTFYGAGTDYTYRASATIGTVISGSKQTFTGLSFAVTSNDYLGIYASEGKIKIITTTGAAVYYMTGDHMTAEGAQTYTLYGATVKISIYATGATVDITPKTSADTGSGTDAKTAYPAASHSRAEIGSGADAKDGRGFVLPETGIGVDLAALLAAHLRAETGAGSELSALLAALLGAETGSGIEALLNRAIALAEIASGIENLLNRDITLGDIGIGADLAALVKTILCAETGTAFENSYLHIIEGLKYSSDSGAGDDVLTSLAVAHLLSDTGAGIDAIIARALFAQEYPTGAIDIAKTITAAIAGAEVGVGVELSLLSLSMQQADSGSGSEASSLLALFTGSDLGAGAEAITLLAAMVAQDTGTSVEVVIAMLKRAIDSGVGAEAMSLIGAVGRAMKLITYVRSYRDLYVYTRQCHDLKVYTNMR
jgi:hypothetical protein